MSQNGTRRSVEQIDQAAVVSLRKALKKLADQQVEIEFPPQAAQVPARSAVRDRFRDAKSPPKAGDDSSDG